jgi:predicted transcriptional regulator
MKLISAILLMAAAAIPSFAQRDFLTTNEVEQVRDTQEPNARLKLYILFARQRMDQFQQLLKKDRKGRSLEARQLLEDYANILDAMSDVSDDALKRHVEISEGLKAVAAAEQKFLGQLQKVGENPPADIGLYDTAFKEAMAATSDGIEAAQGDTGARATELAEKEEKEKKESKTVLAAEDGKGNPAQVASTNPDAQTPDNKPKRKPPTLLRPGEKLPAN